MPAVSKKQQKFFGIVRAIQKGEMAPTTPETAKAAADMKKGDVKKFASTKHKGLPEKKKIEEDRQIKKIIKQLRKSVKSHDKQADTLEKKLKEATNYTQRDKIMKKAKPLHKHLYNRLHKKDTSGDVNEESNPRIPRKKGQPANSKKHSDLYTDENPKGTIHGLGFKDVATAKASVAKIRKSNRSHAHKIQAAVAMEQRAREMGKTSEAAVYRKFINSMKKKTKKMNEAVSMKDVKKLKKAASLDMSKNPKDWESARARRTEIDFKDLMRQKKKGLKEEEISTPKYEDSGRDMKDFTSFMEASKTCPKGEYYCFTEKKCKPLPSGYRIGYGGRLAPDNRSDSGKGGNGNGKSNGYSNGNGSNGNGGGNGNGGNGGNGGGGGNGGNGG